MRLRAERWQGIAVETWKQQGETQSGAMGEISALQAGDFSESDKRSSRN